MPRVTFRNPTGRDLPVTFTLKFPAAQATYDDLVWTADEAFMPMPTGAFEVAERLFLPVATGRLMTSELGVVGDKRPRFSVANAPQSQRTTRTMRALLED